MSHADQVDFCQRIRNRFPDAFRGKLVLDIGSLDINGNNRYLFESSLYLGVDLAEGPNVDIVSVGHELGFPDASVDVVVSTECFEHDRYWASTIVNIIRMLKPGGMFLFSCATTGRPEHGTRRTSPNDAPLLEDKGDWADYYHNLTEAEIRSVVDVETVFSSFGFEVSDACHDLYFWGRKAGISKGRTDYSFCREPSNVSPKDLREEAATYSHRLGSLTESVSALERELKLIAAELGGDRARSSSAMDMLSSAAAKFASDRECDRLAWHRDLEIQGARARTQAMHEELLAARLAETARDHRDRTDADRTYLRESVGLLARTLAGEVELLSRRFDEHKTSSRQADVVELRAEVATVARDFASLREAVRAAVEAGEQQGRNALSVVTRAEKQGEETQTVAARAERAGQLALVAAQRAEDNTSSIARALTAPVLVFESGRSTATAVQLLELWDETFVEAMYQVILGRSPDVVGRSYYLNRVRSGVPREDILCDIANSLEATVAGRSVPGLAELLESRSWSRVWIVRLIRRVFGSRILPMLRALENRISSFEAGARGRVVNFELVASAILEPVTTAAPFEGSLLVHPEFGLVRNGHFRVGILATKHTLFVAYLIERQLKRVGAETFIITSEPAGGFEDVIHFVVCPQMFSRMPGMYVSFQMEQSVSSRWFTPEYFDTLRNSIAIFDYSPVNIEFLRGNGIAFAQLYYLPIGYLPGFRPALEAVESRTDVVFYGDANNDRRRRFLSKLRERFNVRVISDVFGEEMLGALAEAKVVVNIHYYEGALLETTRLYECLSLHQVIVSERSSDFGAHRDLDGLVDFVDIDDADAMVERVAYWLENDRERRTRRATIESTLAGRLDWFEFFFHRFLLANDVIHFDRFWELCGSRYQLGGTTLCLGLPEEPIRRRAFESENHPEFISVPGLRHQKGWIGCALSYKWLAALARQSRIQTLVVCEDDTHFFDDFGSRWGEIRQQLDAETGRWDVFSGFMANVSEESEIRAVATIGPGVELVRLDRMISTVFNAYSLTVLEVISLWDPSDRCVETNTIDRYLERSASLRVLLSVPFLVGHKEDLTSTIWHFKNTQYNLMIKKSLEVLGRKIKAARPGLFKRSEKGRDQVFVDLANSKSA